MANNTYVASLYRQSNTYVTITPFILPYHFTITPPKKNFNFQSSIACKNKKRMQRFVASLFYYSDIRFNYSDQSIFV